jgi:hypothetical protein
LARACKSVARLDANSLQDVAQFIDAVEHNSGCITPAENFIVAVLNHHYQFGGLTPGEAIWEIENPDGFRINFEEALSTAKSFSAVYPQLVNAHQAPDSAQPEPQPRSVTAPEPRPEPQPISAAAPNPQSEPPGVPEWVTDTPEECEYRMYMWVPSGETAEEISMTREEYMALKNRLAVIRGYTQNETRKPTAPAAA